MAVPFQPIPVSATDSPRSRRSVQQGPSTAFTAPVVPEEYAPTAALHTTDRNASNVDQMVLDSGIAAAQQPIAPGSSHNTSSSRHFSSRLSQLAKRAMGKPSINPERRAEEGRPLASARGISLPAASLNGSSSQTVHDIDPYEGTTEVGHNNYDAFAQTIGSPVYVEPKPTNDYAKMESPPPSASIVSFKSYINRVKQFFHELNELPWVAERITVDFVPSASKGRRQACLPRLHSAVSWYGNTPHTQRISLFSDTPPPTSQFPQAQLPSQNRFATFQAPSLGRSLSAQQPPSTQQESPRAPTPPREVSWEIIDPASPSNAPYAVVVPADWSLHHPLPLGPLQPTIPTQQPQTEPHPPPEPQPAANPPPTTSQHPASTWAYPGRPTDGFQRFVPIGETFPTGYVPHAHLESVEAAYQDRIFHPRPPAPQNPTPQQSQPMSTGTDAAQAGLYGFGAGAPQTTRGLDEPFTTSLGQAQSTSLPYDPSSKPPVVIPTPRVASWSAAPTPHVDPTNVEAAPRETAVSFTSPGRPPSAAPSRASRTSHPSRGSAPSVRENRPPSAATSYTSRAPSVAVPAMSQTPNRPPSVALSHASRATSVRASQNRPPSAALSHTSRAPSATAIPAA